MLKIIQLVYMLCNLAYILYAYKKNEKGTPILEVLGVAIGEKLPQILKEKMVSESERNKLIEYHSIQNFDKGLKAYLNKKIGLLYIVLFLGGAFALIMQSEYQVPHDQGYKIERPAYGEGNKTYELNYRVEEQETSLEKTTTIEVPEQMPDEAKANEILDKSLEQIEVLMIPEGSTKDRVVSNLNFIKKPYKKPITFSYVSLSRDIINDDGELKMSLMSYENTYDIEVQVTATYGNYEKTKIISFEVYKALPNIAEEASEVVGAVTPKKDYMLLPNETEIGSRLVTWSTVEQGISGFKILLLTIVTGILLYTLMEKELGKELAKKKEEVLLDFPDVVNKLTILISAGMTFARAWNKIVADYQKSGKKRPLYEEMVQVSMDMQMGVPESEAIEKFGQRSKSIEVIRLSSILIQNMKHGSQSLVSALDGLRQEVWQIRTTNARKLGEKASTKLLLPTFIGLLTVLLVVLAPTFMNMSI